MRVAAAAACLGALALAGCGASAPSNSAVTVAGPTLSIYAGQPPGAQSQVDADVLDGEKLALKQSGDRTGSFGLRLAVVHGSEVSANARDAVSDKTAIAYVGEVRPGASGVSVQITNELGLLQISPTDTSVYLTRSTSAVSGSPQHFYPAHSNFQQTFARVVPNTAQEAKALVSQMRARHLTKLYVADDGSAYGASVALEVRQDAPGSGLSVVSGPSSADAVFYGGTPGAAATKAIDGAAAASPTATLFAPSGLYDDKFVGGLSAAAQKRLYVSAPGYLPQDLTAAGRQFQTQFAAAYGHAPAPQAIFGYASMQALLQVLRQAGAHANSRSLIVAEFRSLRTTAAASALGTYSISGGDTSIAPFVLARPIGGKLVPRTSA